MHLDDDVGGVYLDDVGLETADGAGDLRVVEHHRRRELVEARLPDEELLIGEVVGFHHINFLLDLLGDLDNEYTSRVYSFFLFSSIIL